MLLALLTLYNMAKVEMAVVASSSQDCCDELQFLQKVFTHNDAHDCEVGECWTLLAERRALKPNSKCPLSEIDVCQQYAQLNASNWKEVLNVDWSVSADVTAELILQTAETLGCSSWVIFFDASALPVTDRLFSSFSARNASLVTYDVTGWAEKVRFQNLLSKTWEDLGIKSMIVVADVLTVEMILQEAHAYIDRLGRMSALYMTTQWITAASSSLHERLSLAGGKFDNFAAVLQSQVVMNRTLAAKQDILQCVTSEVATLMYTYNNGSRGFQPVTVLSDSYDVIANNTFPNLRFGFSGRTLIVGTKQSEPFVMKSNVTGITYSGLCIDLLQELASALNFSYRLVEPVDNNWGTLNSDNHWDGLVGLLERKEVDLVIAPLIFTPDRSIVMDATIAFYQNYLSAVFRMPDPASKKWLTFLKPFRGDVLLCIFLALVCFTLLMHVLVWVDPLNEEKRKTKQWIFPGPSPDDGFWFLFGALFSQGGDRLPDSNSGRMLIAAWLLFTIVVGATYSGNLIAFLTVQFEMKPFQTMEELSSQDTYKWGCEGNSAVLTTLLNSSNSVIRALGNGISHRMNSDPSIISSSLQAHKAKVMGGNYAFIAESSITEAWARETCDFSTIAEEIPFLYSVYLPKGSPYTGLFNEYMLRITESGLILKWKEEWWADEELCASSIVTESPPISVWDVQSILYLSVVGVVLGTLVLALEHLVHRYPTLRAWCSKVCDKCVSGCEQTDENAACSQDQQQETGDDLRGSAHQQRTVDRGTETIELTILNENNL